ncbi:MAG: hypothetical protein ACYC9I_04875, partial [Desulfuromonadales bacterium]
MKYLYPATSFQIGVTAVLLLFHEPVSRAKLFSQNLLDLTGFALDFAGNFFGFALGLEFGVVGDLPGHFLDLAFRLVQCAFRLVPDARFHDFLQSVMLMDFSSANWLVKSQR